MAWSAWLLYAVAVLVLVVTPGPSVLMCVSAGAQYGLRKAWWCALGSAMAVLGIMAASAAGLGALLAASELAFITLKWAGVAYLLYLGLHQLRSRQRDFALPAQSPGTPPEGAAAVAPPGARALWVQGLLVGASNPKALLFFTAFFPQFIDPAAPQLPQFAIMAATFVGCELLGLNLYAAFGARLSPWLRQRGRALAFNRVTGSLFVAAALLLAGSRRGVAAAA